MEFKKDDKVKILSNINSDFTNKDYAYVWRKQDKTSGFYEILSEEGNMLRNIDPEEMQFIEHEDGSCARCLEAAQKQMDKRSSLPYIVDRFRSNKPLEVTSWLALFSGVGIKSGYFTDGKIQTLQSEILVLYKVFRALLILDKKTMCNELETTLKNAADFEKNFLDLYKIIEEAYPFSDEDRADFEKKEKERAQEIADKHPELKA